MWDSKKIVLATAGVMAVLLLYNYLRNPLVVTVTGTGEVTVPASKATISFSMTEANASAVVAINNLRTKAEAITIFLKEKGAVEADIFQSQTQITPAGLISPQAVGYQATLSMGAKFPSAANAAELTALLYEKGAAVVSQPVLSVEDEDSWDAKAFAEAMKDSRKKAVALQFKQLKLIRQVASIVQSETSGAGTVTTKTAAEVEGGLAADSLKIVKTVSVTYKLW